MTPTKIRCDHFLFAMFPEGYRPPMQTLGVRSLLSDQNLGFLRNLTAKGEEFEYPQNWFQDEEVISVSCVHSVKDLMGRRGDWNHTILLPFQDLYQLCPFPPDIPCTLNGSLIQVDVKTYLYQVHPLSLLKPFFITDAAQVPTPPLQPIIITKK